MSDPVDVYEDLLREQFWGEYVKMLAESPLFTKLRLLQEQARAQDEAYLASLTDAERRRVLLQRRIASIEGRYRRWWEANMAWRFRTDPPGYDSWDWPD